MLTTTLPQALIYNLPAGPGQYRQPRSNATRPGLSGRGRSVTSKRTPSTTPPPIPLHTSTRKTTTMLHHRAFSSGVCHTSSSSHGAQSLPSSHRLCSPAAAMGGRGGGGYGSDSGLILGPNGGPGQRQSGPPGRLILPGGGNFGQQQQQQQFQRQGGPGGGSGIGIDGPEPGSGPTGALPVPNKYRPPPGFMNDNVVDPALNQTDPQEMLNKLRNKAGQWHQLAKLLPVLYAKGFDSNTIAEITGLNPLEQNSWVVAGTVYDSVAASNKVDESVLAWFDFDGDSKLYHFRFLPAERRAAAAQYIKANDLDAPGCEVLARAMKEWDRRPGERTGFTNSPGDCMAFKHLRDAIECRTATEAAEKLQLALATADSETAVERLTDWQQTELEERRGNSGGGSGGVGSSKARLAVLRLSQDELGFRPLPQISPLSEASVEELQWAPRTTQEGAFGAFELQAGSQAGQKWVALPQWKALALARHPVAIPLPNCAADAAVLAASRAKTEEEKKKLTGVGLLVVDTEGAGSSSGSGSGSSSSIDGDSFYLVAAPAGSPQQLQLVDGAHLAGREVVATVLFLCRPPNRESTITSAELLQL